MTPTTPVSAQVEAAIATVVDPCAESNGTHHTLADLGMVYEIDVSADGDVVVSLLLDDPVCAYIPVIHRGIRDAALAIRGVRDVRIQVRADQLWAEDRMTGPTRALRQSWARQREVLIQLGAPRRQTARSA